MSYYLQKILSITFEEAVKRTVDALKQEGFGVLTEIEVRETLKKKLGVDLPSYGILGACNPELAYEVLKLESHVCPTALMLMRRDATVCICHAKTRDLAQFTILADILVFAAGKPNLIVAPMVKTGAVVID